MKTDSGNDPGLPWLLRLIARKIFPQDLRESYVANMEDAYRSSKSWLDFVPASAKLIATSYRVKVVSAFDKTATLADIAAVLCCFAASSPPLAVMIVLGSILIALALRGAHRHFTKDSGNPKTPYFLDSLGDAVTTAIFMLASQMLMLRVSPDLTLPGTVLYRGAFICLPTLSVLRMILRPKPDPKVPFEGSSLSVNAIFIRTWALNIVWMLACFFTIVTNRSGLLLISIPGLGVVRDMIPILTFMVWGRLQQDGLTRDNELETINSDLEKNKNVRKREYLMKGIDPKDPYYRPYIALQVLFFIELSAPLVYGLLPWFSGRAPSVNLYQLGFNLATLWTLAWTWNYVKRANSAAALAIQKEIDGSAAAALTPIKA